MSAGWIINVAGQFYGPYTDAQMAGFIGEGRVARPSLVAAMGESLFRPAGEDPRLSHLFGPTPSADDAAAETSAAPTAPAERERRPGTSFGRANDSEDGSPEVAHFIVLADMKSGSITGLEEELHRIGQVIALLPQVWLVRTEQSANAVRNLLVQQLGRLDRLFVADATNDKAAWFNFAPEIEARIRRFWSREAAKPAKKLHVVK